MMASLAEQRMAEINTLTAQLKQARLSEDFSRCDQLLDQRHSLIAQLVTMENGLTQAATQFLQCLLMSDAVEITQLVTMQSAITTQQIAAKRGAKSINRYLYFKQF